MAHTPAEEELLQINQRLLNSIIQGDWNTYAELCDPSLTAFEPEAVGNLVEGLPFHQFYFQLGRPSVPRQTSMSSPHVRLMGDSAVLCYVRVSQSLDADGRPVSSAVEETRVWQKQATGWKHVHFHRSPV